MLPETAGSVAGTRAVYQENADHTVESAIPLPDVLTDIPNEPTTASLPAIDTEKFTAVSEHGGSLKEALQRFKDDPELPLPRCVRDLGFTSTNQLIQRFEGTDDPTKRAPTMKEIREARKKEAEKQITPAISLKKLAPIKDAKTESTTKTDPETDKPAEHTTAPPKTVQLVPPRRIDVLGETPPPAEQPRAALNDTTKPGVKDQTQARIPDVETEATLYQQALARDSQTIAETEQSVSPPLPIAAGNSGVAELQELVIERIVPTDEVILPGKQLEPMSEATPEKLVIEPIHEILAFSSTDENSITSTVLESTDAEAGAFGSDDSTAEIDLESFLSEMDDTLPQPMAALTPEVEADLAYAAAFESGAEAPADAVSLEFAADTVITLQRTDSVVAEVMAAEVEEPLAVPAKLEAYIQSLEPERAAAAEAALTKLVEALHIDSPEAEAEVEREKPAVATQDIEHLSATLLDALNLDSKEESVQRFMHALFTPELFGEIAGSHTLSISQLNHLGTHEYKLATATSLFAGLARMIKQHVESYVRLGKYALSASLT